MTGGLPPDRAGNRQDGSQLLYDLAALHGVGAEVIELCGPQYEPRRFAAGVVRIGVYRSENLPCSNLSDFDILLCADPNAPRPWVGIPKIQLDATVANLRSSILRQSVAATVIAQVLRLTQQLSFDQALLLESLAYSTLLASEGFLAWRAERAVRKQSDSNTPRVLSTRQNDILEIRLNRPNLRNAIDARMRDELVEALEIALHDTGLSVELKGEGTAFSSGGDLNEFGSADDIGQAHLIRTLRSPCRLVHELGSRVTARLHGPCIGAGIEIAAAAARVTAQSGSQFQLPEVSMGLMPGAGGTVSISRRIGSKRTCYMAISGTYIDLPTALSWGLVDAVEVI